MTRSNGHPYDLDAKRAARLAAQAEAESERFRFQYGGRDFSLPREGEWPANAKRLLDNGDLADFLDSLLDDPEAFWAIKPTPTNADVRDLMDAFGRWVGVGDLGESEGSPPVVTTQT